MDTTTQRLSYYRRPLHHNCGQADWVNGLEEDVEKNRAIAHQHVDDAFDTTLNEARKVAGCHCARFGAATAGGDVMIATVKRRVQTSKPAPAPNAKLTVPTAAPVRTCFPPPVAPPNRGIKRKQSPSAIKDSEQPRPSKSPVHPPPPKISSPSPLAAPAVRARVRLSPPKPKPPIIFGVPCPVPACDCWMTTVHEYYEHLFEHHCISALKCPFTNCAATFGNFDITKLRQHSAQEHQSMFSRQWQCQQCPYECSSIILQVHHNFEQHLNGQWNCRKGCKFVSKLRKDCLEHEQTCCRI